MVACHATALKGMDCQRRPMGAGDLNVQIHGASDGSANVVNFDKFFTKSWRKDGPIPGRWEYWIARGRDAGVRNEEDGDREPIHYPDQRV